MEISTTVSFSDKDIKDLLVAKATENLKSNTAAGSGTVTCVQGEDGKLSAQVIFRGLANGRKS